MIRTLKLGAQEDLKQDLFSLTKQSCDDSRAATTVKNGQDKQWFFIRRVYDKKIPYGMKTQRSRSQIGASVTYLRKGD
jgi:hypothetical protein